MGQHAQSPTSRVLTCMRARNAAGGPVTCRSSSSLEVAGAEARRGRGWRAGASSRRGGGAGGAAIENSANSASSCASMCAPESSPASSSDAGPELLRGGGGTRTCTSNAAGAPRQTRSLGFTATAAAAATALLSCWRALSMDRLPAAEAPSAPYAKIQKCGCTRTQCTPKLLTDD